MKKIIPLLMFIIYLATAACQHDPKPKLIQHYSGNYEDTVQLNTVMANISNYAHYCTTRPFHTPINSYEIETTDLLELLNFPPDMTDGTMAGVRGYLGIQYRIDEYNDTIERTTHLYLTPVNAAGQDSILWDSNGKQFLYDLTTPCPKTCDTSSVLYKAFQKVWDLRS